MKSYTSIVIAIVLIASPSVLRANELLPLVGMFYDNQLKGSVEAGALYVYERVEHTLQDGNGKEYKQFDYLKFAYMELEEGREGSKVPWV